MTKRLPNDALNRLCSQFVFCRDCLQGYHLGECLPDETTTGSPTTNQYAIDPNVSRSIL